MTLNDSIHALKKANNTRLNALLIVTIASTSRQPKPFHFDNENNSYAYLSALCSEIGLDLHITHFKNYLPNSRIFSWTYREGEWILEEHPISEMHISYADLPQNFLEANNMRQLLIAENISITNELELSDCLTDKVATYHLLSEFMAPTFDVCEPNLMQSVSEMPLHSDLIREQLILKPRHGERGKGIEIIDLKDLNTPDVLNRTDYIIQPLIESSCGIPSLNIDGRHDLRMMICNGEILQFFVRIPTKDSFISNKRHGGTLFYYELSELPQQMVDLAKEVDKRLSQYSPRIYSIDVGVGKSGKIWIYELNTMPGIVWEEKSELDKEKNIEIHQALVGVLQSCRQNVLKNRIEASRNETALGFQQNGSLIVKDGFYEEKDHFNETLLRHIENKLYTAESSLFKGCRKSMNEALDLGRAGDVGQALDIFESMEAIIGKPDLSLLCKLLIATFYSSGLAYLRVKDSQPKEADALSLQALAIDNFLIQEHGIEVLELHRVQQITNLARIQIKIGQQDEAFDLLFALVRSFEHHPSFPVCHKFNTLNLFNDKYPTAPPLPLPIGQLPLNNHISKIYETPLHRFQSGREYDAPNAIESLFLLDFSALTADVIETIFNDVIIEFARFTQKLNATEVGTILSRYGFRSIEDLSNFKAYETAYSYLSLKIHEANGAYSTFLRAVKSFCTLASFQPKWKAIAKDFAPINQHSNIEFQDNILGSIGNTPLIKMNRLNEGLHPLILCKMEFLNPGGSSKDRIGIRMIEAAELMGLLHPGGTIIEPTSGNTGIGLVQAAVLKGYQVIFTMNEKVCQEKRNILEGYGAKIIICPCGVAPDDPRSYYKVAERLAKETPNSFSPNQYANTNNPLAHYETTAPEIWRDTDGLVTHFVAGMGTGGTISGIAKYLKEQNPNIKIIGVDPEGSLYRHHYDGTDGNAETYKMEGIGQDFIPDTMDLDLIDEVITITDKEAYDMARAAAKKEAWMVGSSSGAVIAGALKASKTLDKNAVVVLLLPDSGRNYLSTVFNEEWLAKNELI